MFDLGKVKSFMVIGAHCDDVEGRTGAIFSRLVRQGARGTYVVAVENPYVGAGVELNDAMKALETRREESRAGAAVLGAARIEFFAFKSYYLYTAERELIFPAFRDREEVEAMAAKAVYYGLPPINNAYLFPECVARLTDLIAEEKPDLIITHASNDRHPDHYGVARFVDLVVGDLNDQGAGIELWFRDPGAGAPLDGWRPQILVEVSAEDVEISQRALDCFPSQHPKGIDGFVERRTKQYGRLAGVPYAQGFTVAGRTRKGSWDDDEGFAAIIAAVTAPFVVYPL
ncbi:MAG: hypothetical protein GX230_07985 [Lentisphaerae bacterium]|jgi:LmbE family N-acetylglucosaminyl deacetylase|nr:hypothetical protein [Lentisphaerota bacterium]